MSSLVTCWSCNVLYSHSLGQCPACGAEYRPSEEEVVASATDDAIGLLKQGIKLAKVRTNIATTYNLSDQLTDDSLTEALSRVRIASKQHGQHIAGSGCVLLLIAGVSFFLTGGFLIATGCVGLGAAMLVIGILKARTGWNITGHDFE